MDIAQVVGYILAIVVGAIMGLIGSGGSILSVPILVYVMGMDPVSATAYSLVIVGATALVGGLQSAVQRNVDFPTVWLFGIPSIIAVYLTRAYLLPLVPDVIFTWSGFTLTKPIALMVLFAVIMLGSSLSMIRPVKAELAKPKSPALLPDEESGMDIYSEVQAPRQVAPNYPFVLLEGALVGVLTGLVGAGGGFLIIPTLVLLMKMPMRRAVGTSLFIIAAKSLLGFLGDVQQGFDIQWSLLLIFSGLAIAGIFLGNRWSSKIKGPQLKTIFGWFVFVMGIYVLIKELFL